MADRRRLAVPPVTRVMRAVNLVFPFLVIAAIWEVIVWYAVFPPRLFPDLLTVGTTFIRLLGEGILVRHTVATVGRLVAACLLAGLVGVSIGILMGRYALAEDLLLPLVSIGGPIPGIGYAPLFVLWFGLGSLPAVLLVAFASLFPVALNTWTGVRSVKRIWIQAAEAIGTNDYQLFHKVILPAALPFILTGCRLGFARAWRVLVGVEMLISVPSGLGWLIFGAREFLSTDIMLAGIAVIGVLGLTLEKLVFEPLERFTVVRWGMLIT